MTTDNKRTFAEIKRTIPLGARHGWSQVELDRAYLSDLVERMRPYVKDHRLCILDYACVAHGEGAESEATRHIDALLEETKP